MSTTLTHKLPDITGAGGPHAGNVVPLSVPGNGVPASQLVGNPNPDGEPVDYLDLDRIAREGLPPVPWLMPGWLAEGDVAVLAGEGAIGKSTTAAALALALASGTQWCGITPPRAASVLYFDEEQGEDEVARIFLRLHPLGTPLPQTLHVAAGQGINLNTGLARLEREIHDKRPELVVLDSVQQTFGGVDLNNASAVAAVYAELFRLRRTYGVSFLLIHHLRKPAAEGGSSLRHHRILGSVAFFTQASTAWVAMQPAVNVLDLVQDKRRRGDRTSLRIRYEAPEGAGGPAILTVEGPVENAETQSERAEDFIVAYLTSNDLSRTAKIIRAGTADGIPKRHLERALRRLSGVLRTIEKPERGFYQMPRKRSPIDGDPSSGVAET